MLTSDLAQSWQRGERTGPRLIEATDVAHLRVAEELIGIVQEHEGRTRAEVETALELYVGTGTDYKTLRGLIKLIIDRCEFATQSTLEPAEIRRRLFLHAQGFHPVTTSHVGKGENAKEGAHVRTTVIAEVAAQLNTTPAEVEGGLYADLAARQRLISFDAPTPEQLLDRYNLAQAQALLYRALELRLSIAPQEAANARQIFNAIKSYRLIHTIQGSAQTGYEVTLTGPVSMFHRSQKYGIQMAVFLPALLLCKGWHLRAEITPKQREGQSGTVKTRNLFFELDNGQDHLRSHLFTTPETQQGELPSKLLAGWERTKSTWTLSHTSEVIDLGASAFVPDLVASHPDGRRIYIEVFGFWTPTHLARRTEEFHREDFTDWLLVASDELRCSREPPSRVHSNVLICKAALDASLVRMKLDEIKNAA
jgi:hypothetical protein